MFAPVLEQTILVADNGGAVRWRRQRPVRLPHGAGGLAPAEACAEENGDSFVVCGLENATCAPVTGAMMPYTATSTTALPMCRICTPSTPQWTSLPSICRRDNAQEVYEKVYGPRFGQELAVAVSGKCWIDVTNPGVTKGKAVERLSRLLDIPSGA